MSYQRIAAVEAAVDGKALMAGRIMGMTSKELKHDGRERKKERECRLRQKEVRKRAT